MAWAKGKQTTITTCPISECNLQNTSGINGLSIGLVVQAAGSITKFGDFVALTDFNVNPTSETASFEAGTTVLIQNHAYPCMPLS